MRPVKNHVFNGNRYKICHLPPSKIQKGTANGTCDPPNKKEKKIEIANDLSGAELLRVYCHESLHACEFQLFSEEAVDKMSTDIAKFLWRLGYRKIDE